MSIQRRLGVVVTLSTWRATVHYADCTWYCRSAHRHLPLPRRIRVRVCGSCRPSEHDLRTATPEVSWYVFSPSPGRAAWMIDMDFDHAENPAARRSLGYGRRLPYTQGWS